MPFLRFSKDRRGYESTYLLRADRTVERSSPVLLYWFRTPPYVKIGRAALDEDTVRLLEDLHPHVNFDWPRILATRAQPAEPADPAKAPRARRREDRWERPAGARTQDRPVPGLRPPAPRDSRASVGSFDAVPGFGGNSNADLSGSSDATATADVDAITVGESDATNQPEPVLDSAPAEVEPGGRRFVRVFDAVAESLAEADGLPTQEPARLSEPAANARLLGSEQLLRLRGRYAAVMARIGRRVADAELADRLRALAERANPDAWVTEDDVRTGLASLEEVYAGLVPHIGQRRRRRRGGRAHSSSRHEPEGLAAAGSPGAPPPEADGSAEEGDEE